jgi:hypothetical protein
MTNLDADSPHIAATLSADHGANVAGLSADHSDVSKRGRHPLKIDGRSAGAVAHRKRVAAFRADLGPGELTKSDEALIQTAAVLDSKIDQLRRRMAAGHDVPSDELVRLSGTLRRVLEDIATRAAQRKPDPLPWWSQPRQADDGDDNGDD